MGLTSRSPPTCSSPLSMRRPTCRVSRTSGSRAWGAVRPLPISASDVSLSLAGTTDVLKRKEEAMKAMLLTGFGGTDMLCYGDAPDPVAGPGDIVVDIYAASVNAADSKVRRGPSGDLTFPHILGRDFSGVISAVGMGVDDLEVGDEVF